MSEHALHLVDEGVVGAGVVHLHVVDAQRLELARGVLGGAERLPLFFEAGHRGDTDDVPLAHHLESVRAQHEVERLVPRDVHQVERHLPLHVVGGDDVQVADVGQHPEHVLDVSVLEVERDALAVEGHGARHRRLPVRLPNAGRRGTVRWPRRRRLRLGFRGRRGRFGGGRRRGLGHRCRCRFDTLRGWRLDRFDHGRGGGLRCHPRGGRGGGRHVRGRLDGGRMRRLVLGSGGRAGVAELGDQRVAVRPYHVVTRVPAEVEHEPQAAFVRGDASPGNEAVTDGKAGLALGARGTRPVEVDHQAWRLAEQELVHIVGCSGQRDVHPSARACGLDVDVANGDPRRGGCLLRSRCRARRVAGRHVIRPVLGHGDRPGARNGPDPRRHACGSQHERQHRRLEPPHRFPLSAVRSSNTTSVGWCSP